MANDQRKEHHEGESKGRGTAPVLVTRDLVLSTGVSIPDMTINPGLTLIRVSREQSATVLSLTLAGRMKPQSGTVSLNDSDGGVG